MAIFGGARGGNLREEKQEVMFALIRERRGADADFSRISNKDVAGFICATSMHVVGILFGRERNLFAFPPARTCVIGKPISIDARERKFHASDSVNRAAPKIHSRGCSAHTKLCIIIIVDAPIKSKQSVCILNEPFATYAYT